MDIPIRGVTSKRPGLVLILRGSSFSPRPETSACVEVAGKEGDVGTELQCNLITEFGGQANAPHLECRINSRGGIGTAAAQATADRYALVEMSHQRRHVLAERGAENCKRTQHQVAVGLTTRETSDRQDIAAFVVAKRNGEFVGQANSQEKNDGRKGVVTSRPRGPTERLRLTLARGRTCTG